MMWDMELVMALEEYALPELEEILSVPGLSSGPQLQSCLSEGSVLSAQPFAHLLYSENSV